MKRYLGTLFIVVTTLWGAILTVACYDIVSPPPIVLDKPYTREGGLDGIITVLCSEPNSSVFLADTGGQSFVTCGTRANHTFSASEQGCGFSTKPGFRNRLEGPCCSYENCECRGRLRALGEKAMASRSSAFRTREDR